MDLGQLHEWSRRFARLLLRQYPEWERLCEVRSDRDGDGFLFVTVPPASDEARASIWVSTEDFQITVGICAYHAHFVNYDSDDGSAVQRRALKFIEQFRREELVLVEGLSCGKYCSGWISKAEELSTDPPETIRAIDQVRISSWLGSRDAEFAV